VMSVLSFHVCDIGEAALEQGGIEAVNRVPIEDGRLWDVGSQ
jgi:hypothetical protein